MDEPMDEWDIFRNTGYRANSFPSESQASYFRSGYFGLGPKKDVPITPFSALPQRSSTLPNALLHLPGLTGYFSESPRGQVINPFICQVHARHRRITQNL